MPDIAAKDSSALIIVDLLIDFFDRALWPHSDIPQQRESLTRNTNDLVSLAREFQLPVLWVRQEFEPDLSDAFLHMRRQHKKYTVKGTPGANFLPELQINASDPVITKKRFSAFFRTKLDEQLAALGVTEIILAGITTTWCIRETAVDAYQRDFLVTLAKSCTAAFTAEDHDKSIKAMDGYIAKCFSIRQIRNHLEEISSH
ncbi:isochorismatase family protein [candidate division KSB1 bacterium]|nr:isochorismatase family protein [candidate division KSB1 bacterium]